MSRPLRWSLDLFLSDQPPSLCFCPPIIKGNIIVLGLKASNPTFCRRTHLSNQYTWDKQMVNGSSSWSHSKQRSWCGNPHLARRLADGLKSCLASLLITRNVAHLYASASGELLINRYTKISVKMSEMFCAPLFHFLCVDVPSSNNMTHFQF